MSSITPATPRVRVLRAISASSSDRVLVAFLVALAITALFPVFSTGFILIDDHEILSFTDPAIADPQLVRPPNLGERIFVLEGSLGRVRPLYWVVRYAEIDVLKSNSVAWHVLLLGMGLVSAVLLFGALRLAGIDRLPAVLASAWLLVAPGVSSVWIRLGPVESLGVLLVVVAAYSAARGASCLAPKSWDVLFAVSLAAAALAKEPFAVVPPALVGWRLFLRYRARGWPGLTGSAALVPTLVPVAVGAIVMLVSLKLAGSSAESYGGRILASAGSSSVTTTLANLEILTWLGGVVIPLLVAGAVIEAARHRRLTPPLRYWLLGASLGLLLVVPQLAVYRGESNFGVGRYILPAGLGMVASIAAGNAWLRRQKYVALYVSVATILAVSMPIFGVWTLQEAQQYRADSFVLAQAVGAITASARSGTTVGIAADPLVTYEYAVAFPYQLTWRGRADLDRRLLIAYDPQADSAEARAVGENLASRFPGHADLAERGCTNVDAVVLLAPEDRVMHLMPCLASSDFRLATFSETVAVSNFLPSPYRMFFPPRTVGYQILMRHSP